MSHASCDIVLSHLESVKNAPLLSCSEMFPWAQTVAPCCPPAVHNGLCTVLCSEPRTMEKSLTPCSAALQCRALKPEDIFVPIPDVDIEQLLAKELPYGPEVVHSIAETARRWKVIPLLLTDAHAWRSYVEPAPQVSVSAHGQSMRRVHNPSARSARRFDLQPAKAVEIASTHYIYCDAHIKAQLQSCSECEALAEFLKIALELLGRNYDRLGNCDVHIIRCQGNCHEQKNPLILSTALSEIERLELELFTKASLIDDGFWCGNSPDYDIIPYQEHLDQRTILLNNVLPRRVKSHYKHWSLQIKCDNTTRAPDMDTLAQTLAQLKPGTEPSLNLNFFSSGKMRLGDLNINTIEVIVNMCYLIYQIAINIQGRVLAYCPDGYTQHSFLVVAYCIFVWNQSLEEVLLRLHLEDRRPVNLFTSDLQILSHLQMLLRKFSPRLPHNRQKFSFNFDSSSPLRPIVVTPEMFTEVFLIRAPDHLEIQRLNGPLPSRILNHLYLGSLQHGESYKLLERIGITHIVSVGEKLSWVFNANNECTFSMVPCEGSTLRNRGTSLPVRSHYHTNDRHQHTWRPSKTSSCESLGETKNPAPTMRVLQRNGFTNCWIDHLADNGKDPLMSQINKILEFIDDCYRQGGKVLVHCMAGVSRSAAVCIAECMRRLECDLLTAYTFVRVRRLNVIIQPSLMFMYELEKWNESRGKTKTIEWYLICREISKLNERFNKSS